MARKIICPLEGIVLTDTFESTETEDTLDDSFFGTNDQRLKRQQEKPITAIIGNPPYSIGQGSQNDNNQNASYTKLDSNIEKFYKNNNSMLNKGIYDSYIRAFRWATDRLNETGVIGFISNSGFIDKGVFSRFRESLFSEFNYLYVYNLKGAIRGKNNKEALKEGGNIFDILTGVAITILVKDGTNNHELYYDKMPDYASKMDKLKLLTERKLIEDTSRISPDENNDWINLKDNNFSEYENLSKVFGLTATGVSTNRDSWVINYSKIKLEDSVSTLIENYNTELNEISKDELHEINTDESYIKWTVNLLKLLEKKIQLKADSECITSILYRPFTKKWIYYNKDLVERPSKNYSKKFGLENKVIVTSGRGIRNAFSVLASKYIVSLDFIEKSQGFMRFDNEVDETQLFQSNDNMNQAFADKLGLSLDDTFAYVYGLLNSREYQEKYANDLKKDLARIPIVKQKDKYVEVGKALMDLHLNYEEVPVYEDVEVQLSANPSYVVTKMKFAKKRDENGKSVNDLSTIIYNQDITISNIPEKAYEYMVNGRSAIEWIIDQYQVKTDKKSGITDDPNDYSTDEKYIFNLLLRIINVSLQTVDLVNSLPKFEVEE